MLFGLLEESFLEAEHYAADTILRSFRIADHEIPAGEKLPGKNALVLLLRELTHARVFRHP